MAIVSHMGNVLRRKRGTGVSNVQTCSAVIFSSQMSAAARKTKFITGTGSLVASR
jgi:hypothetical protein